MRFGAFLILMTMLPSVWAQPARQKVILDTDIGTDIDDAWALGFVAQHKPFEVLGVTITDANTPARAKVACKLLHAAGRTDIPVAVGRVTPYPKDRVDYQFSWAEDFTEYRPIATPAAQFIVQQARKYPGQVTLLAVGPLQNVADAIRLEPNLPKLLRKVVLMSGNVYGQADNRPVVAEWNVKVSIKDSQVVYGAGFPSLTIVPLDSTTLVKLSDAERDRVRKRHSPVSIALESLYRLWLDTPSSRMTLHDQLAVAETAAPGEYFDKTETLPIYVDDEGFTKIDKARGKPVHVCLQPKRDKIMSDYLATMLR